MRTWIEINIDDDKLFIREDNCTGEYYKFPKDADHGTDAVIDFICDYLRDYLRDEVDDQDTLSSVEFWSQKSDEILGKDENMNDKKMTVTAFPELQNWVDRLGIGEFNTAFYAIKDDAKKKGFHIPLNRQEELTFCSNLIADMVMNGATDEDLRKVVMYSMVVLDAEKLNLDWEQAQLDFEISQMMDKYQKTNELHSWQKRVMAHDQKFHDREEKRRMVQNLALHGMSNTEIAKEMNIPESTVRLLKKPTNDPVNHPSHYTDGKIEVIDFIEDKKLGFCLGNAVKYISRAGKKNPDKEIEDLEKAAWYVQRRIYELKNSEVVGYKIS